MSIHHSFNIELAEMLGSVELALLIHHFQHWVGVNKRLKRNFKDERTWTFQTREEIAAHLPYLSADQVRRLTDKLVEKGILRKENFNRTAYDKTIWYAFENEEMFMIGKFANGVGKTANGVGESATAIPSSKPYSKITDAKDLGHETLAPHKFGFKNLDIAKRWKLNQIEMETFEWLKAQGIDADDPKLAFWSKTFTLERLIDVFNEAKHNGARSYRKYMGKLLDEQKVVHNSRIQGNADFAKDFAKSNGWRDLKIYKKHIKFHMGNAENELSLDMDPDLFVQTLIDKYDYSLRY